MRTLFSFIVLFFLLPSYPYGSLVYGEHTDTIASSLHNKQLQTIIVDHYYPYTFVNQDGAPDGFTVELIKAVTQVMGMDPEIRVDTWDKARSALQTGSIDFLPMMAYSVERDKEFDFSAPHTIAFDAFFTRKGTPHIRFMDDLRGKEIIVMKNDQAHDFVRSTDFIKSDQLILIDSLPQALRMLSSGKADTALMPELIGLIFIKDLHLTNLELEPIVVDSYLRPFSFAVKEGNPELLERLSQGLSIVRETGRYKILYEKWFGAVDPEGLSAKRALKNFILISLVFILGGGILFLWSLSLKKQVAVRTRSLKDEIHERRHAEDELRKSEDKYRTLIENLPQKIFLKDSKSVYLSCNDNFAADFNMNLRDIAGKTDYDFFPKELAERYRADDKRILESDITEDLEEPYSLNGEQFWIHTVKTPVKDDEGNTTGILGIFWDITKRKKAEEARQESESQYRSLFENIPAGFAYHKILVDESNKPIDYVFLEVNLNFEKNTGLIKDDIIGKTATEVIPGIKDSSSDLISIYGNVAMTGKEERFDRYFEPFKKWYAITVYSIKREYFVVLFDEITARKEIEEDLKLFRTLIDQSNEAIFIIDPATSLILDFNPTVCNNLGYDCEELLTMKITDIEASLPDSFSWEKHVNELKLKGSLLFEGTHKRKDGSTFPVEINAKYLTIENSGYMLALARDITNRKKLESQLLHAQKMESIGTLAGGIAHDFNNIITAIMGFSSILNRRMQNDDPLHIYVENIQTAAENAANLTSNLLTFSRKQIIKPILINLNELIKKVDKFLLRIIGEDIQFKTVLADKQLNVMVDFGQMEQVLMNLVTNARDAMPKGGELTICTESFIIDNEFIKSSGYGESGQYARISISDTGTGIDEFTKHKIFEPFFTTKEVDKGTGLGLAMVYGIIKQHHGYINVDSALGKGTTFTIYIPMARQELTDMGDKAPGEPAPAGGHETILIAEDDSMLRELMSSVLAEFGYNVITAEDGEDAVIKFIENKDTIQFLILDAIMPKKYGADAYDEIKKIKPHIKGIFLSGYTKETIQEKDITDKGTRLIYKPIRPEDLLKIVREELDK